MIYCNVINFAALSATIHELEEELGIENFDRNNKGISLSEQGSEFLAYAKQAVSQYELIEDILKHLEKWLPQFHWL